MQFPFVIILIQLYWSIVSHSEMFSFVLTGEDGSRRFGYCRRLLVNESEHNKYSESGDVGQEVDKYHGDG